MAVQEEKSGGGRLRKALLVSFLGRDVFSHAQSQGSAMERNIPALLSVAGRVKSTQEAECLTPYAVVGRCPHHLPEQ